MTTDLLNLKIGNLRKNRKEIYLHKNKPNKKRQAINLPLLYLTILKAISNQDSVSEQIYHQPG